MVKEMAGDEDAEAEPEEMCEHADADQVDMMTTVNIHRLFFARRLSSYR